MPPSPEQVTEYVTEEVCAWPATLPDTAFPVAKFVPVQEVAPVDDHVIVGAAPYATGFGEADMVAVGFGAITRVTVVERCVRVV